MVVSDASAQANAEVALETAEADADLAWATTTAGDQKTYAIDEAAILRDYTVTEASLQKPYEIAVAQKGAARDKSYAAAEVVCDTKLTIDDNAHETAAGNALADFWSAEYSAQATVMVTFAGTLGTPWATLGIPGTRYWFWRSG